MPPTVWKGLLRLAHPDHHAQSPLLPVATEVTRWLLAHRPQEVDRG
jgi:hypothetical protein